MPALGLGLGTKFYRKIGGFQGLLDLYGGAAAAYSLERLAKDATNVVRVRRSSDDTEQDFTAAQVSDGTLTTFTGAGDGFVRTWYDQSGNDRHAQQSTAASQPQIVSGGSLITDSEGNPAIGGDGANDSLILPSGFTVQSIFGVWEFDTTEAQFSGPIGLNVGGVAAGSRLLVRRSNSASPNFQYREDSNAFETTSDAGFVNGVDTRNFTAGLVHISSKIRTSSGAATTSSGARMFESDSSVFYKGPVTGAILYPDNQSANRAAIEAKLAEIYGITLA